MKDIQETVLMHAIGGSAQCAFQDAHYYIDRRQPGVDPAIAYINRCQATVAPAVAMIVTRRFDIHVSSQSRSLSLPIRSEDATQGVWRVHF